MPNYAIIETDDGLTVVEIPAQESPESVALENGAALIDPGPYASYEEAYDAMMLIPEEDEEE
jgi:hypothetical protein